MSEAIPEPAAPAEPVQQDLSPAPEPVVADPSPPAVEPTPAAPSNWRADLPEGIRNHETLAAYDDKDNPVAAALQDHVNAQALIGKKGIIPPQDDSPEEQARFYEALGRPKTAQDYDVSKVEIPEGLPINEGLIPLFLERAHARGLSQDQAAGAIQDYVELQNASYAEAQTTINQHAEAATAELRAKWGSAFDQNLTVLSRFNANHFGPELMAKMENATLPDGTRLGDDAGLVEAFVNLAKGLGEDSLEGEGNRSLTPDPQSAVQELAQLRSDTDFQAILADKGHPEHAQAVEKRAALYRHAYGNEVVEEVGI